MIVDASVITSLAPALLMGLLGGAHCVVMCGGVAGLLAGAGSRRVYVLAYNAGRVLAYGALGAAFGGLSGLAGARWLDAIRFGLRGAAALCMLGVGLHLVGLPSFVRAVESLGAPLFRRAAPLTRRLLPLRRVHHAIAVGALWGLMPCGLLYGALALAASSASPVVGGATMLAFGAGTLPLMLTVGALAARFSRALASPRLRRAAGAAVLGFGMYGLAGTAAQLELGTLGHGHGAHACCPRTR